MTPDITKLIDLGGTVVVATIAFYSFVQIFKMKKNGNGSYQSDLAAINTKLSNHLTEVNGRIDDLTREVQETKIDIKIIKDNINDIKIAMKH